MRRYAAFCSYCNKGVSGRCRDAQYLHHNSTHDKIESGMPADDTRDLHRWQHRWQLRQPKRPPAKRRRHTPSPSANQSNRDQIIAKQARIQEADNEDRKASPRCSSLPHACTILWRYGGPISCGMSCASVSVSLSAVSTQRASKLKTASQRPRQPPSGHVSSPSPAGVMCWRSHVEMRARHFGTNQDWRPRQGLF